MLVPRSLGDRRAEVGHDREHAPVRVAVLRQVELAEDRAHVRLDGLLGQPELFAMAIRPPSRQGRDLALPRRQLPSGSSSRAGAKVCGDWGSAQIPGATRRPREIHRRRGYGPSAGSRSRRPSSQAPPHTGSRRAARGRGLRSSGVMRGCRPQPASPRPRMSAACGRRQWRGRDRARTRQRATPLRHRRGDLVTRVLEEAGETLPKEDRVLGDHDPHGIATSTRVPLPCGLTICNVPPCAATRSRRPASPEPRRTTAPPTPSSATVTCSVPLSSSARTVILEGDPCLTAFVSASHAAVRSSLNARGRPLASCLGVSAR